MSNTDFNPTPSDQPGGLLGQALGQLRPPRFDPEQGNDVAGGLWGAALRGLRPPNGPREPYIPASPRPANQWGKPDYILEGARNFPGVSPGPFMPQGHDVQQLMRQVLGGLGRFGSPNIAMLARAAGGLNSKWLKEFLQGREYAMKLLDQQHDRALEEIDRRQQEESERYGIAMDYYKNDPVKMHDELRAIAQELNDTPMLQALDSGDATAPQRLQQARDRHWLSLAKFRAQNEKYEKDRRKQSEEETRRRQILGDDYDKFAPGATDTSPAPDTGGTTETPIPGPAAPATPEPEQEGPPQPDPDLAPLIRGQPQQAQQQPAQPTAQPAPGAAPQARPQPAVAQNPEEAPPYQVAGPMMPPPTAPPENAPEGVTPVQSAAGVPIQQSPGLLQINPQQQDRRVPPYEHIAKEHLMGRKVAGETQILKDPIIFNAVLQKEQQMRNALAAIERAPVSGQQVIDLVRDRVDPELAIEIQNYADGLVPPPRGYAMTKEPWSTITSLARKYDPTMPPNGFAERYNTIRSFTTGQDGRNMQAFATAGDHLEDFRRRLLEIKRLMPDKASPAKTMVRNWWEQWFAEGANAKKWRELSGGYNQMVHNIGPEVARAISGKAPTNKGTEDAESGLHLYNDVDAVLSAIDATQEMISRQMQNAKRRFEAGYGKNPAKDLMYFFQGYNQRHPGGVTYAPATAAPDLAPETPPFPMANPSVSPEQYLRRRFDRLEGQEPTGLPGGWSLER